MKTAHEVPNLIDAATPPRTGSVSRPARCTVGCGESPGRSGAGFPELARFRPASDISTLSGTGQLRILRSRRVEHAGY
jgi:hypothetical protein